MGWLRKGFSPDKGGRAPRGAVGCSACLVLCFLGFLGLGMGADFGQTAWIRLVSGFPPAAMAAENPLGRAQERTCREVEQRIKTLLSPVYGDGHVVVMASTEDAGKGGHIRAAIIIDTAAMQDVHLSPDGIVAEQNRIVRLVSHAAGLDTASGDSVAVSFLSFSAKKNDTSSMWILLASAGLLCLSAAGWLYLRVKRSQLRSGRPAERNEWRKNDSGGESDISLTQHGSRSRVNRELSVFGVLLARENAQSRAAALTLFPPEQAVRVLGCWPEDEQADIILRLAGTGRIKDGVIALLEKQIEQEFQNVSGLPFAFVGTEKGVGGPSAAARILRCLDADTREKLFEKIEESGRGKSRLLRRLCS